MKVVAASFALIAGLLSLTVFLIEFLSSAKRDRKNILRNNISVFTGVRQMIIHNTGVAGQLTAEISMTTGPAQTLALNKLKIHMQSSWSTLPNLRPFPDDFDLSDPADQARLMEFAVEYTIEIAKQFVDNSTESKARTEELQSLESELDLRASRSTMIMAASQIVGVLALTLALWWS